MEFQIVPNIGHTKIAVEHVIDEIRTQAAPGTSYDVGANIVLAPGALNDSETASFLSALQGALAKFAETCPAKLTLNVTPKHPSDDALKSALNSRLEKAFSLQTPEKKLITGV